MSDGTGIVHIAPAFGEDDAQVGRKYDLPFVQFVDGKGSMTEDTPYAGLFVKDADPKVLVDLDKEGLLFDAPKFEHDYPFCWRCDTPLIYYARESWFIKMTAVKDDLVRNNKTINWIPASIGEGRFGNWLENIQDWGISRNRYWGTPLNIWECECGHQHSIGSREELYKMSGNEKAKTVEFHRPYIDEITITCPECGKPLAVKFGKTGQFLACTGYPACRYTSNYTRDEQGQIHLQEKVKPEFEKVGTCPECGKDLVLKRSRTGSRFIACSGYPDCKHAEPYSTGVPCPREGCNGVLVEKSSKRGKIFYSCSNYPQCDYALWDWPIAEPCPECGSPLLVMKNTKAKGKFIACPEKTCKYTRPLEGGNEDDAE